MSRITSTFCSLVMTDLVLRMHVWACQVLHKDGAGWGSNDVKGGHALARVVTCEHTTTFGVSVGAVGGCEKDRRSVLATHPRWS